MTAPVLTGAQVKAIRLKLGKTLNELARDLGAGGTGRSPQTWMWQIENEMNGRHLSFAQANLLLAIKEGYVPVSEYLEGQ